MNKDENQYQPISCALYSEYELAIMRHQQIRLVWHEDGQTRIATVTPLDLKTKNHQEFLIAKDHQGQALRIRLDFIRSQQFI